MTCHWCGREIQPGESHGKLGDEKDGVVEVVCLVRVYVTNPALMFRLDGLSE